MIERKYIDMILERIDIEDVVSNFVELKRRGNKLWACCPFHNENTPSFCVMPDRGKWRCYGACQEGGNVIDFYMKATGLPFPKAVKQLLHDYLHVRVEDAEINRTPGDIEKEKRRQSMFIYNKMLCDWFQEQIEADTPEAKTAKDYAKNRWGEEQSKEFGIGYAPDSWSALVAWATGKGLDLDILLEMKVLMKSEKNGSVFSLYRNRVMIPIRDRYNRVIGFTARTMDEHEEKGRKYVNSASSLVYNKDKSVFGIDNAVQMARKEEKIHLVEGVGDAIHMQLLGLVNTVASLGGRWTENQLNELRGLNAKLCIIPDSDLPKDGETLGAGFKLALDNGMRALKMGFNVSVREIPASSNEKRDPDSYITTMNVFNSMKEEEFILWYARLIWDNDFLAEERAKFIADVCDLLVCIKDEAVLQNYITALVKRYHDRAAWQNGLIAARRRQQKEKVKKYSDEEREMFETYGFTIKNNSYYAIGKDGAQSRISNCVFRPRFHIVDDMRPVRIFDLQNDEPGSKPVVIELDMDTLTSSKALRKKLIGMGNYIWLGDDNNLIQILSYLAKTTETAVEVKQMGWQKQGFFCFCNGVQENGVWTPVDKMGIVRLKSGNYYIPAMSELYENSTELYTNERRFIHLNLSNISLHDYLEKIVSVFGDNAIIGLCFLLATLFRDIIKAIVHFYPILNVFGPKGSGKTQLANTLMTLLYAESDPPNIETATMAALSDAVASCSNALVHIDEFKNSIGIKKIEWAKDLWGGIGRMRMNMDKDKKREQARVDCGVILTGQEMPTADIALFTRLIFLTYDKQHHTKEERDRYNDLLYYRKLGATHLTLEILKHRESFKASFNEAWKKGAADLESRLDGEEILDRIEQNWIVPLAAFLALEKHLDLPFTYEQVLDICVRSIKRQNSLCNSTDEVATFWNIISSAQQKGIIRENQDFMTKYKSSLRLMQTKEPVTFAQPKHILMLRKNIALTTYRQLGKQMDEKLLPSESIMHYLTNTPEYIGSATSPIRFKRYGTNGMPLQECKTDDKGNVISTSTVWDKDRPMYFDYETVCKRYGIILDSDISGIDTRQDSDEPLDSKDNTNSVEGDLGLEDTPF